MPSLKAINILPFPSKVWHLHFTREKKNKGRKESECDSPKNNLFREEEVMA